MQEYSLNCVVGREGGGGEITRDLAPGGERDSMDLAPGGARSRGNEIPGTPGPC